MSDIAIQTHELSKRYTLGTQQLGYTTLREALGRAAARPLSALSPGRSARRRAERAELWALRDLSLTIRHGEVLGLIGHNGAGKSTVLKILTRITEPTSGWAEVTGRVGSLLEVGTGFHPELTGRENVFLQGAILGMRRDEIRRRFDEIIAFSEVEEFLDTPVKRYSSGMQVRLAFSVAAHLEPEILLVDEVLAVGDASFQRKSLGKMQQVAGEGRTVIFVSHNLAIIRALCTRGVVLERGGMVIDAPTDQALDHYLRGLEDAAGGDLLQRTDRDGRGWDEVMIKGLEIEDASRGVTELALGGNPATIVVHLTGVVPDLRCILRIYNSMGTAVATFDSEMSAAGDVLDADLGPRIECALPSLPLLPGRYRIDVEILGNRHFQDGLRGAAFFDVEPGVVAGRPMPAAGGNIFAGSVFLPHAWRLPS